MKPGFSGLPSSGSGWRRAECVRLLTHGSGYIRSRVENKNHPLKEGMHLGIPLEPGGFRNCLVHQIGRDFSWMHQRIDSRF